MAFRLLVHAELTCSVLLLPMYKDVLTGFQTLATTGAVVHDSCAPGHPVRDHDNAQGASPRNSQEPLEDLPPEFAHGRGKR